MFLFKEMLEGFNLKNVQEVLNKWEQIEWSHYV